jgi:hypothetical protein
MIFKLKIADAPNELSGPWRINRYRTNIHMLRELNITAICRTSQDVVVIIM